MKSRSNPRHDYAQWQLALSLFETLLSLSILATLAVLTPAALSTLESWRGLTAVQQVAADLEAAKMLALSKQQPFWVAFSGADSAYQVCQLATEADGSRRLLPVGPRRQLPTGQVLTATAPALASAGCNLLLDETALMPVHFATGTVHLPCLGFGLAGEVIHPPTSRPLLALAEGYYRQGHARNTQGRPHRAEACRWLALHRHTGTPLILP